MKRLLVLFLLVGILGVAPAHAAENEQVGLYVGGKLGMSIERFDNARFGLKGGSESFPPPYGDLSWNHQSFGLGDFQDSVPAGGLTLGYDFDKRFNMPVRVELDYTLRGKASDTNQQNDLPWQYTSPVYGDFTGPTSVRMKNSLRLQTLMLNAWWDIDTGTAFTPYIGGGLGCAFGELKSTATDVEGNEDTNASDNFANFAWSLGGGLGYAVTEHWTVDLGYRYINAGDHEMEYDNGGNYVKIDRIDAHDIMLSLRYTF
ncbi:outer membrane protein [Nitratidesulfovibrio sp. D1]|uniref:outer membrane protein n=1 Tax=Nitratidesulfovibrio sp. D1 TaxID=3440151 RepID=UPI003EB8AA85